jgi:hypothetical protein
MKNHDLSKSEVMMWQNSGKLNGNWCINEGIVIVSCIFVKESFLISFLVTIYVAYHSFIITVSGPYWICLTKSHVDNGFAILRFNHVFTKVSSHAQTKHTILVDNVSTCQKCHIHTFQFHQTTLLSTK